MLAAVGTFVNPHNVKFKHSNWQCFGNFDDKWALRWADASNVELLRFILGE